MTDDIPTDAARPRRPLLGVALVLGGVAVAAWWRQARRDPQLIERTRARLIARADGLPAKRGDTAVVVTRRDRQPAPRLVSTPRPEPLSLPAREAAESTVPRSQGTEPFSPDLRGVRVG